MGGGRYTTWAVDGAWRVVMETARDVIQQRWASDTEADTAAQLQVHCGIGFTAHTSAHISIQRRFFRYLVSFIRLLHTQSHRTVSYFYYVTVKVCVCARVHVCEMRRDFLQDQVKLKGRDLALTVMTVPQPALQ